MSIMTLDSHSPAGTPNPECLKTIMKKRNLNNFTIKESFKCTSAYVREFIEEFRNLNLDNTKLVIIGDHLLMKDLKFKEKYFYNKFFINNELDIKRDYINFFDLYPSILEVMKFRINNDKGKVALGFSVFTDYDKYQKIQTPLKGSSKLYDTFWQIKTD